MNVNLNIFTIAPNDASIAYLSQIFGNISGVLCQVQNGVCVPQGGSIAVLASMFQAFNSTILVIAVLMLVYITVLAVIGTAHEGEFMGKKMNNIWIPIRAVLGIALLVPTGAGYCGIQIIMMWIIVQGIGAADMLWSTTIYYVTNKLTGSPYAQTTVPVVGANKTFNGIFRGLTCYISTKQGSATQPFPALNPDQPTYSLGNCGSLNYCNRGATDINGVKASCTDETSVQCQACKAQIAALAFVIPMFGGIAQSLVAADTAYQDFYNNSWNQTNGSNWNGIYKYCSDKGIKDKNACCIKGLSAPDTASCKAKPDDPDNIFPPINDQPQTSAPDTAVKQLYYPYYLEPVIGQNVDFIKVGVGLYQDLANGVISGVIAAEEKNNSSTSNGIVNDNKDKGWIFAGALYYQLANMNSTNLQDSSNVSEMTWTDSSNPPSGRNNLAAADYLAEAASGNNTVGGAPGATGAGADVNGAIGTLGDSFLSTIGVQPTNTGGGNSSQSTTTTGLQTTNPSGGGGGLSNPLMTLQIFGMVMLIIVETVIIVIFAVLLVMGIAETVGSIQVLGFGVVDPMSSWGIMMTVFLVPAFWAIMGILVAAGATLAVYTPLLPFIYFTFGALTWMIAAIEAMVAGPLVALGIISPSGQHEIMGKAEPAIMLLFGIFLRPSLMIFGLIAAMLLAVVACTLVNDTFAVVMKGWVAYDPLSLIFVLCAYVSLILAVLNQCFKVINLIPQQVMRWISGQGDAVETPTQDIKGGVDAGAGRMGGGAEGTGDRFDKHEEKARASAGDKGGRGVEVGGKKTPFLKPFERKKKE